MIAACYETSYPEFVNDYSGPRLMVLWFAMCAGPLLGMLTWKHLCLQDRENAAEKPGP